MPRHIELCNIESYLTWQAMSTPVQLEPDTRNPSAARYFHMGDLSITLRRGSAPIRQITVAPACLTDHARRGGPAAKGANPESPTPSWNRPFQHVHLKPEEVARSDSRLARCASARRAAST